MRKLQHTRYSRSDNILRQEVRTASQDERKAEYEAHAKRDHDRLIEMGGRPTRPVRLQPEWTATYKDRLIYIIDKEGGLECTLSDDIDPMSHHWEKESVYFMTELENWQKFRENQQKFQHWVRLEIQLKLDNTEAELIKALTDLRDWQEFEVFQRHNLADALQFEERCGQNLLQITEWEVPGEHSPTNFAAHDAIGSGLRSFDDSQEEVEAAKRQFDWVKDQWPKVVAEALDSISVTPELQSTLEAKFREQTYGTFNTIQKLGRRPSHAIEPPDETKDSLHRILHWNSETSKYMEDLLDWEQFLQLQRHNQGEGPILKFGDFRCPQFQSTVEFLWEYEIFRQFQYDHALTWLKCRQRVVRWYEEEIETPRWYVDEFKTPEANFTPGFLYDYAQTARSNVKVSEQKLADAAMRLEEARQEYVHALGEQGQSSSGETEMEGSQKSLQSSSSISSQRLNFPQSPQSSQSSHPSPSPRSPRSPERLCKDQRPPSDSNTTRKRHRRSKKQNARKKGAKTSIINTRQQPLPEFPTISHNVKEDNDIHSTETPSSTSPETDEQILNAESEDAAMTDFNGPLDHTSSH